MGKLLKPHIAGAGPCLLITQLRVACPFEFITKYLIISNYQLSIINYQLSIISYQSPESVDLLMGLKNLLIKD